MMDISPIMFKNRKGAVAAFLAVVMMFSLVFPALSFAVTITFYDGAEVLKTENVTGDLNGHFPGLGDKDVTPPSPPAKEGKYFTGWTGSSYFDVPSGPGPARSVYANYADLEYTVTLVVGDEEKTQYVVWGEDADFGQAPEPPDGYKLVGWDSEGKDIKADTTITAELEKETYTVAWVAGDSVVATVAVKYSEDATPTPKVPAKKGYTGSWESDGKNITEDTTITAKYCIESYPVAWMIGTTVMATETVEYNQKATKGAGILYPEFEGMVFKWDSADTSISAPTTITGSYSVAKFNVKFVVDGSNIATEVVEYGMDAAVPTPVKEGYTLSAWAPKDAWKNVKADTTVTASFAINKYLVTYIVGNSVVSTQTIEHGKKAVVPVLPELPDHVFTWDSADASITADITITGSYKLVSKHLVSFVVDGEVVATQTVVYGENATLPAAPVKAGYVFIGWDSDGMSIKDDTTITGSFKPAAYEVKFVVDGSTIETQSVEDGKDATLPMPVKAGYTFMGWDSDGKNITGDTTISGEFKSAKVSFPGLTKSAGKLVRLTNGYAVKTIRPALTIAINKRYGQKVMIRVVGGKYKDISKFSTKLAVGKAKTYYVKIVAEDGTTSKAYRLVLKRTR